jgi:FtsZ-interacting cell division protein YlmF
MCYGLEGDMERVSDQIFLLTPHGAEVSDDERRRMRDGDLGNGER